VGTVDVVANLEPCVGMALALQGHIPALTHGLFFAHSPNQCPCQGISCHPNLASTCVHVENLEQVLGVFLANIFHAKIFDAERKGDGF
jgi:hypothetical protein